MAEIQALTIRHEAILDYLMANPTVKLGDVAKAFGVTAPWLSQIIHSDAFQSKLKEKQDINFHSTVLPIREKMLAVAHLALDQLADKLPLETEPSALSGIAGDVLDRLGFSSKTPATVINNTTNVQVNTLRSELDEARALLGRAERPKLGVKIDGELVSIGLPLSGEGEASMGESDQSVLVAVPALDS